MEIDFQILLYAVVLGVVSAASLPLGSIIGLWIPPRDRVVAALAAFGAGALLAALAVELVAPTLAELEMAGDEHADGVRSVLALIGGALVGGVLFVTLDRILSERGAFLRKTGTAITHFRRRSHAVQKAFLSDLCSSAVLRRMPPEAVADLAREVEPAEFAPGEALFHEGDSGDHLYFIRKGRAEFTHGASPVETLGSGDLIGELALLTGAPRAGSATANGPLSVLRLSAASVAAARARYPELNEVLRDLASSRLERLHKTHEATDREREAWEREALSALTTGGDLPTSRQLHVARKEHSGAGLAVWLGILLDGIPESIVIGASFAVLVAMRTMEGGDLTFATLIPYTLVAGLFLSNLPEAMSSSIAMKREGFSSSRVLTMWVALVVVTGLGAGLGFAVSDQLPVTFLAAIEGMAAGAMLTAIASTMIPEAVHLSGGHTVGLGTLAGFLSAVAFKLLE
jgi:CRP-like cAMP-binding protein